MAPPLQLSGIVVHWGDPAPLADLIAAWPGTDPRFELIVVDNTAGRGLPPLPPWVRRVDPGTNLGFGGGANVGAEAARAAKVLILNSDAHPEPDALERLVDGFERFPDAVGLAPRLLSPDGTGQHAWQLRGLPGPETLLFHALFLPAGSGPRAEPDAGTRILQPAAAALALDRQVLLDLGGFDAGFHPAWFEDVDLARRLHDDGRLLRYLPEARFRHALGSTVPTLGYGPFLWVYSRNLHRYLDKHHGAVWAGLARLLMPLAAVARILTLPLRRPRRAPTRRNALAGLLGTAAGALTGWRRPRAWVERFRSPHNGGRRSD